MKLVMNTTIKEYTYNTLEERDKHVKAMEPLGWECSGQIRRLKPGAIMSDSTIEDREWFASFQKYK